MGQLDSSCVLAVFGVLCVVLNTRAVPMTDDRSLNFLILGDWGGLPTSPYRTSVEKYIAMAMNTVATQRHTQFQIALGDNFYYDGVANVKDKRFQQTFESVFTGSALQNPWFFIAGNHDHNGNVSAQIAYTEVSKRWNFPSLYYNKTFEAPDGAIMDVILIDTVTLCGQLWSDFYAEELQGPENVFNAETQWRWIEDSLKASKAHYLIVGGHFPVYSVAEHGSTECLTTRLKPLLYKYNATAYINGHDHNLQHIQESNPKMDYFTIGSANFVEDSQKHKNTIPKNSLQFYNADPRQNGGFVVGSLGMKELSFTFVTGENKEVHKASMSPRKYFH